MDHSIAQAAREANDPDKWDELWDEEGDDTWRGRAMAPVYDRIVALFPEGLSCVDIGGGRGLLAQRICDERKSYATVADHSPTALAAAEEKGLATVRLDLESEPPIPATDVYVATEVVEHLTADARARLLAAMTSAMGAFISVPNNRLGPDEEPQHTIKFTAMSLKRELKQHWEHVRIEPMGPYLLAVVGELAKKGTTLSVTLPVRDEGHDLEITLASFRGAADELIVGIDPRTTDDTWEVAERYADKVFHLKRPMGPPDGGHNEGPYCQYCTNGMRERPGGPSFIPCKEYMGENGIHFAWVRNQCIEQCTGDWIFMTEGHEALAEGMDVLIRLDEIIPPEARVAFVYREGNGQRWGFPWLHRNDSNIRYIRPVHNALSYPDDTFCVTLPQVRTIHKRHDDRTVARASQRHAQNRRQLLDDWMTEKNVNSLFYLGQEWRGLDQARAMERLEQFVHTAGSGIQKYQARLILAKENMLKGDREAARKHLLACTGEDWGRTEHWVWLGDMAMMEEEYEKAYRFYMYAATSVGAAPFTLWWIDLCYYSYLPCQRLAEVCGHLGDIEQSLAWARKVAELLPEDAPQEAFDEAQANITLLQEAINDAADRHP